ncbi:MAG: sigma-70 family RNA polymerase sigma factor [Clostridia bacterium]|nr:sigma-70 family RNA polymerase sigma factor [Clostridia bacterium]
MQNFEKLSDVELIKLAKTNEYAVDEIFARYKPLVSKVARQFFLVGGDLDDLVQEGMIGLYKAIIGYEESKKASFKTFASLCILRNIQTAIKKANSHKNMYFL